MTHDQNFKNLILDYPRQALAFFAAEEARGIVDDARIIPVRQEQLKERYPFTVDSLRLTANENSCGSKV